MKKENYTPPQYRQQIADAVSWELIYQILRRYQTLYDLRVFETHPCDGQYDCLSLYSYKEKESHGGITRFFDFNLPAQSLHVWRNEYKRFDVVDGYLQAEDPRAYLDKICRQAGLSEPPVIPASNGPVLACGVMAGILHLRMFSRKKYKFYMGYSDSSGMYSSGIRKEPLMLFAVTRKMIEEWRDGHEMKFYRYFYLEEISTKMIYCLFDMSGKIFLRDDSEIALLPIYNKYKRNITSLSNYVLSKLPD